MVVTVKSIGKIVMFLQGISGLWEWLLSIPISSHSHIVIPIHIPEIYALWNLFPFPYYSRKLIPILSHSHSRQITFESKQSQTRQRV